MNCKACKYSFMEPDSDLTCGHPDAGTFGVYCRHASASNGHCGPELQKFEQHPLRADDGRLRGSIGV